MNQHSVAATAFAAGLLLLPAVAAAQARPTTMEEMHKLHQDPKAYMAMLDDPARDAWQKPHEVVMALGLKEGDAIADIGAGTGYFAFRFAHHVGATGRVYAVDISPDMILHMNRQIRDLGLGNVRTILAPPDDPLLADHSVDRFFFCESWHHIADHEKYLSEMKRMLEPGGQVIVIDFKAEATPIGPPPGMRVARADVIHEFETHGYRLAKEHTFLPYEYFLVFEPAS
jgi:ubiquinone/menaquinone biosynthesis C-methylase UbiE